MCEECWDAFLGAPASLPALGCVQQRGELRAGRMPTLPGACQIVPNSSAQSLPCRPNGGPAVISRIGKQARWCKRSPFVLGTVCRRRCSVAGAMSSQRSRRTNAPSSGAFASRALLTAAMVQRCWRTPPIGELVEQALLHFDGERYKLHAWSILPNHVHVLAMPLEGWALASILHSWKSLTATRANALLACEGHFWAREYFDRAIRNERHYGNALGYVAGRAT
jgi:hypothetical protein